MDTVEKTDARGAVPAQRAAYPPAQFNFVVSQDKMTAYLRVALQHRDQRVTKDEILAAAAAKGIVFGLDEAEIDDFVRSDNMLRELRVASGTSPVKGENGRVEINYVLGDKGKPRENVDGTVDFKNLEIVNNVSAGDVLCTIHPPGEGVDGTDVYGAAVKAEPGAPPDIPGGDKIGLSEDKTGVIALVDGNLSVRGSVIIIDEVFTVDDVGVATGNIDFNGAVVINGSVNEGFSVKAKSDITVNGVVEGAEVRSGGNILIKRGINGMNKADIFAEGDITSGFIENAAVKCGGNLFADTVLNSRIKAGGTVRLRGRRGALLGGACVAGEAVNARTMGSYSNIKQDVIILPGWYEYEKRGYEEPPEDPRQTLEIFAAKRAKLLEGVGRIDAEIGRFRRSVREQEQQLKTGEQVANLSGLIADRTKLTGAVASIEKEMQFFSAMAEERDFKVVCLGECFPGVRIKIGEAEMRVNTSLRDQTIRAADGELVYNTVMPHERD